MDQSAVSASHEALTDLEGNLRHLKLQDCAYFLRTGTCAFGSKCRYNHPAEKSQANLSKGNVESLPKRPDQIECPFFIKTGACKFGPACWHHHPPPNNGTCASGQLQLNFLGLPLRPSEKECTYYLQTGSCKYGTTCKFHHPEPTIVGRVQPSLSSPFHLCNESSMLTPLAHQGEGDPSPVARTPFFPSTGGMPRPLSVGMVTSSPQHIQGFGLNFFQQSGYSSRVPSEDRCPKLFPSVSVYPRSPEHSTAGIGLARPIATILHGQTIFPERPGQPDCHHYMKTGDCKFGMNCKYHHPKDRAMSLPSGLNPMGLPLRPGKQACPYFIKHSICKFGPVCKFDHPVNELPHSPPYSPSMSSLNEEPVAPFTSDTLTLVQLGSAVSEEHLNSVGYDQATSKDCITDHPN